MMMMMMVMMIMTVDGRVGVCTGLDCDLLDELMMLEELNRNGDD